MRATSSIPPRFSRRGTRLLVLLLVAFGSTLGTARASNWLFNQHGSANHIHTRYQPGIGRFDESPSNMATSWGLALGEWSQKTVLEMPKTTDHAVARIHGIDQYLTSVSWAGLATNGDDGDFDHDVNELYYSTDGAGHYNHSHLIINARDLSPFGSDSANQAWRQSLACHEIGHAIARGHRDEGCMTERWEPWAHPAQHDIDDTNWFFPYYGH